ncbi:MAG TPA: hypothetical protein DDY77_06805 [Clostridiales bacterium]|nr:hypothetical protein [Clostridiales bacterium]
MQKTRLMSVILALTVVLSMALSGCTGGGDNSSGSSGGVKKNEDANEYYVSKLEIVTPPDRMEYVEGEEAFDPTGMVVKATWNDGYVEESVSFNKLRIVPAGYIPKGTEEVRIYYGDKYVSVPLAAGKKYLHVKQVPVKTDYTEGETFAPEGLILEYVLGSGKYVDIEDYDVSKVVYDKNKKLTVADKSVKVKWGEFETEVQINVMKASLKIELEDSSMVSLTGGARTKVFLDGNGKAWSDSEFTNEATPASLVMISQASGRNFASNFNTGKEKITIKFNNVGTGKAKLKIRGASNAYDANPPSRVEAVPLSGIMVLNVNGQSVAIPADSVLEGKNNNGVGDNTLFTYWFTALLGEIDLKDGENVIEITFKVELVDTVDEIATKANGCKKQDSTGKYYKYQGFWGVALGQYDYVLIEYVD